MDPLKIFGWAADHNGCGNYRIGLPMWALSQLGHDALAFSVLNVDIPADLDVLVGQMINDRPRSEVWRGLAERPGRDFALVFEIDDDLWNLRETHPQSAYYEGEIGRLVADNIAISDAVTVTTDHLAEVVSKYNRNVHVLPNCVDGSLLSHRRPTAERLTVGWAGGATHVKDFMSVATELKAFFRRNPEIDTHFVGVNFGATIGRPDTRFTGWNSNLIDYLEGLDFDLGIAPLSYNIFNRSKSDLKFLEYAALGIPVVATDFGPYARSVQHGLTGYLVKHPHEWAKYLRPLVNDADLRNEVGSNARAWAATRTIQTNAWRWESAYRSVLGRPQLAAIAS
jgi:glycosyltransferase involved in cell wall biosynthesis